MTPRPGTLPRHAGTPVDLHPSDTLWLQHAWRLLAVPAWLQRHQGLTFEAACAHRTIGKVLQCYARQLQRDELVRRQRSARQQGPRHPSLLFADTADATDLFADVAAFVRVADDSLQQVRQHTPNDL